MNREEQFVITISRQFGTGGHEIGAELARRLNVKLLDKQITDNIKAFGQSDKTVAHADTSKELKEAIESAMAR